MEERLLSSEVDNTSTLKERIWEESKKIWKVSFPALLTRLTSFGMLIVTQAFVGHIGQIDLAGYALTQTIIVRFVNGILVSTYLYYIFAQFYSCKLAIFSSSFFLSHCNKYLLRP